MSDKRGRQERAAQMLAQGRQVDGAPIGALPEELSPRNLVDAMELQAVLNRQLEGQLGAIVGSKIGCTTAVMQQYLGMSHPCSGAIFESTLHERQAELSHAEYRHVGVECEVAARLCEPIRALDAPHTLETVSGCVGTMHAAIEIVDDRYENFVERIPDWRTWVADNFFGAGVVLGDGVSDWRGLDLPSLRGSMNINDVQVGVGYGRDIIEGHPLEALVWLANEQTAFGRDLPAGWLVMLGSVVQTHWVARNDIVKIEIEGLGNATARFV